MFAAFPLLALPVIVYNLLILTLDGGVKSLNAQGELGRQMFSLHMSSGAAWPVSMGDLILAGSLVVLFVELLKSTTSQRVAIINHTLTMVLFIICLIEFLILPAFATSTFFLLILMVLLDFLAGFIVTVISARRDIDFTPAS